MRHVPIRSARSENDPRPWANLGLTDGSLTIEVRELSGLLRAREIAAEQAGKALDKATRDKLEKGRRPNATTHMFALDTDTTAPTGGVAPASEVHVLAVTLDGDLEFVPLSKQRPAYYAHLAWFDPSTGEWDRLQFIDPTDGE